MIFIGFFKVENIDIIVFGVFIKKIIIILLFLINQELIYQLYNILWIYIYYLCIYGCYSNISIDICKVDIDMVIDLVRFREVILNGN